MKNRKPLYLFTAGIVAVLLGGGGILGALLSGCFTPVSDGVPLGGFPGEEQTPARTSSWSDVWTEPKPFNVTLQVKGAASNPAAESLGSRSIAGPTGMQLALNGLDSIRNFVQLVVMDDEGTIVFAT
jgi:hypothetical protein